MADRTVYRRKNIWQGVPSEQTDIEEIERLAQFRPEGIGGWLLAFVVYLAFVAIATLAFGILFAGQLAKENGLMVSALLLTILSFILSILYIAEIYLVLRKDKRCRSFYWVLVGLSFVFGLFQGFPYIDILWMIYLNRSERVKNTFHFEKKTHKTVTTCKN